jgi:hypothetical protein
MSVVQAKIQTVEEIYRLLRVAVGGKRPIRATYHGRDRWFCPHRLGRNHEGQVRVLCYQYAGESDSGLQAAGSPANWRCIALEKLSRVELLEGAWHTAPNHSRPQTCVAEVDVDAED